MSFDVRRSRQTIFGQSTEFLIGEMLVKAGVIKQSQLDDALKLAGNKHMQIGQMLIMAHYITPRDLQAAIDAQVAVRDRVVEANTALRALHSACKGGMSFAEASQKQSQDTPITAAPNQLGDLLLESNLINAAQLSHALQKSMATGLPVGRILILNNVISESVLSSALEMRIKLRDGKISGEEALAYLRDLSRTRENNEFGLAQLEQASLPAGEGADGRKSIRLGEFLVLAGILSETDVMNALEFSLVSDKPLGRTLVEHGYVTNELIDAAVKLQSLVDSDTLDCQKAALCLNNIHLNSVSLAEAIETVTSETEAGNRIDFQTFLFDSNLINSGGMQAALELAVNNPRILSKILVQTGYLREDQAAIIIDSHEAIIQNLMSEQDAKFVLDFCLQKLSEGSITFAEGLQELGWSGQTNEEGSIAQAKDSEATKQDNIPFGQISFKKTEPTPPPTIEQPKGADLMRSMLGSAAEAGQSFVANPNSSFSSLPAQSLNSPATSTPSKPESPQSLNNQSLSQSGRRTGRTTTNMPALTQLQAGSELMRPPPDDTEHVDSEHIDSEQESVIASQGNTIPPKPEQSAKTHTGSGRPADRSLSLKALLKQEESPTQTSSESKAPSETGSPTEQVAENDKPQSVQVEKKQESKNNNDDGLALSESEKALIMKASSLTASPDEIMAAMKLAARKDKIIQVHDKDEEAKDLDKIP